MPTRRPRLRTTRRTAAALELGARHRIALKLSRLLVSRTPLQYEYCPSFEAILFGAEHITLPLAQRGLNAIEALQRHHVTD